MDSKFFTRAKSFILDLIFPIECVDCGREGEWICSDCFSKVKFLSAQICPVCKRESPWGRVCPGCQGKSFLDGVFISAHYNENEILQKLIHLYKYQYIEALSDLLGERLAGFLNYLEDLKRQAGEEAIKDGINQEIFKKISSFPAFFDKQKKPIILAVPLHKKRFKERGYNQAELLGWKVGKKRNWVVGERILERRRYTLPQAELDGEKRKTNIKDAFGVVKEQEIKGQAIILIDDVFTTGSTMQECARVLKEAGAREIWGLVLAHG